MRALLTGAALIVLATAGAAAQPLDERRPSPPGESLDRPFPQGPREAEPDDDDDDDVGSPLRRSGPPEPDDDADAPPPPPKSDRL